MRALKKKFLTNPSWFVYAPHKTDPLAGMNDCLKEIKDELRNDTDIRIKRSGVSASHAVRVSIGLGVGHRR